MEHRIQSELFRRIQQANALPLDMERSPEAALLIRLGTTFNLQQPPDLQQLPEFMNILVSWMSILEDNLKTIEARINEIAPRHMAALPEEPLILKTSPNEKTWEHER